MNYENFSSFSDEALKKLSKKVAIESNYNRQMCRLKSGEADVEDIIAELCYKLHEALAEKQETDKKIEKVKIDLEFLKAHHAINQNTIKDQEEYILYLEEKKEAALKKIKVL